MKQVIKTTAVLLTLTSAAFAASDGSLGSTSTGELDISITLPEVVRISDMDDLSFGTYDRSGNETANDNVCIYTNDAQADYRITLTGDGAGNAFTVTDGTNTVAYAVKWNDAQGTGGPSVSTGVALANQTNANTQDTGCNGGTNANIEVTFHESALLAAPSGNYSGTLTVMVEPN